MSTTFPNKPRKSSSLAILNTLWRLSICFLWFISQTVYEGQSFGQCVLNTKRIQTAMNEPKECDLGNFLINILWWLGDLETFTNTKPPGINDQACYKFQEILLSTNLIWRKTTADSKWTLDPRNRQHPWIQCPSVSRSFHFSTISLQTSAVTQHLFRNTRWDGHVWLHYLGDEKHGCSVDL